MRMVEINADANNHSSELLSSAPYSLSCFTRDDALSKCQRKKSNIAITGLTASGKTTHSHLIVEEFGLSYTSASTILREKAGYKGAPDSRFWLTSEGHRLANKAIELGIDEELKEKEHRTDFTVFDCRTLPWLAKNQIFSIWIESSIESRVYKAYISHGPSETRTFDEIKSEILLKDQRDCEHFIKAFGINILKDFEPLDVILDISSFIKMPTKSSSLESIRLGQDIISSIVGLYITGEDHFRRKVVNQYEEYGSKIFRCFSQRFAELMR